ncbi:MAG: tRNA pseudouridine synthase A [Methanosaeta sp. PtaB.Bin039]|nr:MAG: tRNA pseudouridine synthase A [Methanosaeta sp. PtaB.Bin039]HOT07444.1 tRNA pseudouridine(38-40) synthase TruA [Methanotrichaceae archaeon]HQF17403.1 tRNA pseudouridine(38-40) synthase TruA [Methanotrichaceae archaeon]HQI91165.1 tRNA pseudouridine(38-40) synthase TruA [Methanotrichaceae archaeon]HQJ29234.1 tRNA pseudouridine(38-40) synthase TruA [Methanotrichaceae archaeon]
MKVALKLAYLGGAYYGFQRQPSLPTVESAVREALSRIGVINGDFCYAGRTDRGVSAIGQVVDFWIDPEHAALATPRVVNSHLPRDIWAWARADAPLGFSARWNAQWRRYRYLLYRPGLDLARMERAAEVLLGEHDFRNFSSAKEDTVRRVQSLDLGMRDGLFVMDVQADGFLWNMVRKIAGALALIGSGDKDVRWMDDLLDLSIPHGAPSAPPEGLILMDVGYEGLSWEEDPYARKRAVRQMGEMASRHVALAGVGLEMGRAMDTQESPQK